MALTTAPTLHHRDRADEALRGPALPVLCGFAWLGVAWGFSFLDRARGEFGAFAIAWLVLGLIGFGLGLAGRTRPERVKPAARVLVALACVFAVVPGLLMFTLLRWSAFALLLLTAARAASMRTHRDLYYALAAIVAVSLLVVVHANAEWTVWFYLAPAWLCIVLALAWDYAAHVRLGAPLKAGLSLAFVTLCIAAGVAVSAMLPLPQTPGFGFLDPPTGNPGHAGRAAARGGSAGTAPQAGDAGTAGARGTRSLLGDAVEALHRALGDQGLPQWQRSTVEGLLAAAEALGRLIDSGDVRVTMRPRTAQEREQARGRAEALRAAVQALLWLLALLLALLLLWRARWRVAGAAAFAGAALLARWSPGASMRCSMVALHCLLHRRGHPRGPGLSTLEHVRSARFLRPKLRQWLQRAVLVYGGWRFGGAAASAAQAEEVRRAVLAADELLRMGRLA